MNEAIWIGLDVGERRIGVAKSDLLGLTAQPYSVVTRSGGVGDIDAVAQIALSEQAVGFVLGRPIRTDGAVGPEVAKVERFAEALQQRCGLSVEWVDERFTTVIAQRSLREQGIKGSAQRKRVDQVAAALILQSFLDRRKNSG